MTEPWQEMLSDEQRRLFNAACGDALLSERDALAAEVERLGEKE